MKSQDHHTYEYAVLLFDWKTIALGNENILLDAKCQTCVKQVVNATTELDTHALESKKYHEVGHAGPRISANTMKLGMQAPESQKDTMKLGKQPHPESQKIPQSWARRPRISKGHHGIGQARPIQSLKNHHEVEHEGPQNLKTIHASIVSTIILTTTSCDHVTTVHVSCQPGGALKCVCCGHANSRFDNETKEPNLPPGHAMTDACPRVPLLHRHS
jgi:hypothetical protein